MGFKGKIQLEYIWGSDGMFRLMRNLVYTDKCGNDYVAKKGLVTDGGSVPKLMKGVINPFGKSLPAFIIHDELCVDGYDRQKANLLLKEMQEALGEDSAIINATYTGVEYYRVLHNIP